MVHGNCPGVERFKNPTMKEKICPVCGEIIEIFSVDSTVTRSEEHTSELQSQR